MKFLRTGSTAVAAMAALVAFDLHAQDYEALPQPESSTDVAQAAPTDVIDLDDPDSSSRLTVPADPSTTPPPSAPASTSTSTKVGPTTPGTATTTASQEANFRATQASRARQAVSEADVLRSNGQLEAAAERLEFAMKNLYTTGASAADYQRASYGLAAIRAEQARLEYQAGNWDEAVNLYKIAVTMDPANREYQQGLASARERQEEAIAAGTRVDDTSSRNPALTPEFLERVKVVRRLFYEYERFVDTGQYDKADDRLKRILAQDPYNRTARQLQRKLVDLKMKSAKEFHQMTRDRAMLKVTEHWYDNVPPDYGQKEVEKELVLAKESRLAIMKDKLSSIIVPSIQFESLDITQVVAYLEQKSIELDTTDSEPRGINFVLNLNTGPTVGPDGQAIDQPNITRSVTLDLSNVPLSEVLRFISTITGLQVKVDEYAVVLAPTGTTQYLDTKTFNVPPGFIPPDLEPTGGEGAFTDFEGVSVKVEEVLTSKGVDFNAPGSKAIFLGNVNKLIVKNTPAQLDIIEALIRSSTEAEQPQVEIETKFAEFTDDSLKALYFQYYYSASASVSPATPFLAPFNYDPAGIFTLGQGSVKTAGQSALRTAETQNEDAASAFAGITPNGVDQLLLQNQPGSGGAIAAGTQPINWLNGQPLGVNDFNTVAIGGVINGRGLAMVMQLIDNMQGVDLLASPKVTTKNRSEATIEIIREMRYPTEFERPEINPEVFTINQYLNPVTGDFDLGENVFVVLPATPREFEIENIGVTLQVTPTTYSDQRIDLELAPEVVDFEGFINYGQPITQIQFTRVPTPPPPPGVNIALGRQVVADGIVNQPVFSVRSITTKLQVLDNQTIVMGGLIREDRQEINDKVPFLGDIPIVGRVFTSKVEKSVKRNLMMFVTARLIKSDGTPLYSGALPEEEIDNMELSPDLTPMIAPPPPPRYIRVRRESPKQMYDGKMMLQADNKTMYEADSSKMFEVDEPGSKSVEFDDTTIYEGGGNAP